MDDFFAELQNSRPFLKVGLEGFAGSGKTYTMVEMAIGLHKKIGSKKPIVLFDTEEAAKFLKHRFASFGIQALHKPSRSLADLEETMKRCKDGASDILLIDSITHVYEDFLAAFKSKKTKHKNMLTFQDWGIIKPVWKSRFSEPFVRFPVHIFFTGRAGYEYEDTVDENGVKGITKVGVKMKAESETAYEPDLLCLMHRHEDILGQAKSVWRECTVLKDRSALIDGKTFRDPLFSDFECAFDYVLSDPTVRVGTGQTTDASELFSAALAGRGGGGGPDSEQSRIDIALEEIEGELTKRWPGQSAEAKRAKVSALEAAFGTTSWKRIETLGATALENGLVDLKALVAASDNQKT